MLSKLQFSTTFVSTALLIACAKAASLVNGTITDAKTSSTSEGLAAGAFAPWRNAATNQCVKPLTDAFDSILVTRPCTGSIRQLWSPINITGTIYQLQNGQTTWCAWVVDTFQGAPVIMDNCVLSSGSGAPSNTLWEAGTTLPNIVQLRSRVRTRTEEDCADVSGSNVVLFGCTGGSLTQRWIVGF